MSAAVIRYLVVPVRIGEDITLARYTVQAAHGASGAHVVLDLLGAAPDAAAWADVLAEFNRTVRGNRQTFLVLLPPDVLSQWAPDAAAGTGAFEGLVAHDTLATCLAAHGPAAEGQLLLTLPSRMEYLAPLRQHVAGMVRALHGNQDAFHVEILLDELCLNAVENSPSSHNFYDVELRLKVGELAVDVTNTFDASVNSARIMARRLKSFDASGDYLGERGRGLFLVARLADSLQIRSLDGDRIQVSATKTLGIPGPDPEGTGAPAA